jgi:hypothetical protein
MPLRNYSELYPTKPRVKSYYMTYSSPYANTTHMAGFELHVKGYQIVAIVCDPVTRIGGFSRRMLIASYRPCLPGERPTNLSEFRGALVAVSPLQERCVPDVDILKMYKQFKVRKCTLVGFTEEIVITEKGDSWLWKNPGSSFMSVLDKMLDVMHMRDMDLFNTLKSLKKHLKDDPDLLQMPKDSRPQKIQRRGMSKAAKRARWG